MTKKFLGTLEFADKKITSPLGRFSYPTLDKAKAFEEGDTEQFSVVMLFPKNADLTKMRKLAEKVMTDAFGPNKDGAWQKKKLKMPFRDGDAEQDKPGYENTWWIRASSTKKPGVLGKDGEPIVDVREELYPGCYGHASLVCNAYDVKGNRGVKFTLLGVMKTKEGERLGGGGNLRGDFEGIEVEDDGSDSEENYSEDYSEEYSGE